jgi:putative ABC transport system substrate-binding protein
MNNRRKLVIVLGAGALTASFGSFAQQQNKIWRVGFLSQTIRPASLSDRDTYAAFLRAMRDLGYVEGKNLVIEWRFAGNKPDSLAALAAELVQLNVDVLVTAGILTSLSAQKATTTIPIVMVNVGDPVNMGLVKSLARPGGNITGLSSLNSDTGPKRLELLLEMVPKLTRVAVLVNPANPSNMKALESFQAAAQKRRVELLRAEARTPQEIDSAFSLIREQNAGALIVASEPLLTQQTSQIVQLAAKNRLPSVSAIPGYAEDGGLMSYGVNSTDQYRRAATFVDKILKGAKPADLPIEQPTKFELVINMKTAKALGLTIPQSLLISADRVIE